MAEADSKATFEINLEDGTSGTAESAASALKKLREAIDGDLKELAMMQKALRNLKAGGLESSRQFLDLKNKMDEHKKVIAQNQAAYLGLGGSLRDTARRGSSSFAQLRASADGLGGPLASLLGRFDGIAKLVKGGAIALGIAAIAAALVALTVAAVASVAALAKYGIAQADARRNELLRLEGLTKLRSIYGFAAGNAREMQGEIDRVSAGTAISRDEVGKLGAELYRAGLRGKNFGAALEGAALKASVLGEEQGHAFVGWAASINLAGGSVQKLTDRVKNRLGRVGQEQLKSLDVQTRKLHEGFDSLFGGLDIEGFLSALKQVKDLFTLNTATGRSLKFVLTTLLQPLINSLTTGTPLLKRFFQGMTIAVLVLAIEVLKLRKWFRDTFGDSSWLKGLDMGELALWAGVAAVAALGTGFLVLGTLIAGALVAALPLIWAGVAAMTAFAVSGLVAAAPFLLAAAAVGALIAVGYELVELWREIDWGELGSMIVDGLVGGLSRAKDWAIDSVTGLGRDMMKSFKDTLGIHSPSREFAKLGVQLPAGLEQGIDDGAGNAQAAADRMVTPTAPTAARGAARSGNVTVHVGDVHVNSAGENAREIVADIKVELQRMLEGVAIELGASVGA
jgi:hypothetical protein